jgi:hypothetical protein
MDFGWQHCSILGWGSGFDCGHNWWRFWFFSLGAPDKCRDTVLKEGATASWHTLATDNAHTVVQSEVLTLSLHFVRVIYRHCQLLRW